VDPTELLVQGQAIASTINGVTGFVLSLIFYILPPVKKWHDGLSEAWKPGVFALLLAVVTLAMGVLNWTNVWELVPKDIYGIGVLLFAWAIGVATNQGTYQTLVRPRKQSG